MNSFKAQLVQQKGVKILPLIVSLILLVITVVVWKQSQDSSSQAYQDYFDFRVREAIANLENRMGTYQQVLHGGRGLFEASDKVSRAEFRDYVFALNLEDNFPGIQGVGFSLIIPPEQKQSHIASVRGEGYPSYNIRPEQERDFYTSIVYLEPLADRNLRAFGYDMYSNDIRREAMQRSRDTDKAIMSGKVRLVQESGKKEQAGFLIYVPVYKNGTPHDTVKNRQANIIGWVYSPFRMDDLMEGVYGELSKDIDIEIFDGDKANADTIMFDSDNTGSTLSAQADLATGYKLLSSQTISIAGHDWILRVKAQPSLYQRIETRDSWPVLSVGSVLSILSGLIIWLLIVGRERALKIAKQMNQQYIESETKLQAILDSSAIGIAWSNMDGEIEYLNPKFISLFGYTLNDIPNIDHWYIRAFPDKKYRNKMIMKWKSALRHAKAQGTHIAPIEAEVTCSDNSVKHTLILGSWAGSRVVVNISDITEQKQAQELSLHMASHDTLTGLANRARFSDALDYAISLAKREQRAFAIFFIDLDKFKPINDELGHEVGDLFLKQVAVRIKECLRESDIVARVGGDEFTVLLRTIEQDDDAILVAEKIRFVLSHPFVISGHSIQNSASIGIAVYPEHGDSKETLVKQADSAMYRAKRSGGDSVVVYRAIKPLRSVEN